MAAKKLTVPLEGKILTKWDIIEVADLLSDAQEQWEVIGRCLDVDEQKLSEIKKKFESQRECKWEMVRQWLLSAHEPTWVTLATALFHYGYDEQGCEGMQ